MDLRFCGKGIVVSRANKGLQATTALNQNCLMKSLSNEVMRRLANISEHLDRVERVKVLDEFSQKLVNSDHSMEVVRRTRVNGIKGHLGKVKRCKAEGKPFHRCAAGSAKSRKSKKLMQKQSWFKSKSKENESSTEDKVAGSRSEHENFKMDGKSGRVVKKTKKLPYQTRRQPSTVLFVEYSKGGSLQKTIREVIERLSGMMGFTMRVTERGGIPLSTLLSNKNVGWGRRDCTRLDCKVCSQTGEKREHCKRRNVLYESECGKCNIPEG